LTFICARIGHGDPVIGLFINYDDVAVDIRDPCVHVVECVLLLPENTGDFKRISVVQINNQDARIYGRFVGIDVGHCVSDGAGSRSFSPCKRLPPSMRQLPHVPIKWFDLIGYSFIKSSWLVLKHKWEIELNNSTHVHQGDGELIGVVLPDARNRDSSKPLGHVILCEVVGVDE